MGVTVFLLLVAFVILVSMVVVMKKFKKHLKIFMIVVGTIWLVVFLSSMDNQGQTSGVEKSGKKVEVGVEEKKIKSEEESYELSKGYSVDELRESFDKLSTEKGKNMVSDKTNEIFYGEDSGVVSLFSEGNPIQVLVYVVNGTEYVSRVTVGLQVGKAINSELKKELDEKFKDVVKLMVQVTSKVEKEELLEDAYMSLLDTENEKITTEVLGKHVYSMARSEDTGYMLFIE